MKTSVRIRTPKVREKKLGREHAAGQCWQDTGEIQIDPRQDSRNYMDTLIHEMLHCFFPDLEEEAVLSLSSKFTKELWKRGYRRIQE